MPKQRKDKEDSGTEVLVQSPPIVPIGPMQDFSDNKFSVGDTTWAVPALVAAAKDLPVFDLPLAGIDLSSEIWRPIRCPLTLARHIRQTLDADLQYPIILDEEGFCMDGWHRITKALVEGRPTIKAVRFMKNPCALSVPNTE